MQLFIVSLFKQLSAGIKMYYYKITTSFEMPQARANKTGFNIMIVHLYFRRKLDIIRHNARFFSMAQKGLIQQMLIDFETILELQILKLPMA